jgi:hypothetical protein
MNFLQVVRISFDRVAENIMTCLWWGVALKISCTSRRMSIDYEVVLSAKEGGEGRKGGKSK